MNCFLYLFSKAFYLWWTHQIIELINLISTVHLTWFRYFTMKLFKVELEVTLTLEIKMWIPMPILDWQAHWIHLLYIKRGRGRLSRRCGEKSPTPGTDQSMPAPGQTSSRHALVSKTKIMITLTSTINLEFNQNHSTSRVYKHPTKIHRLTVQSHWSQHFNFLA